MTPPRDPNTIVGFLDALASKAPTPGGGAAAAMTGATSAATASMVVEYSIGKKKLAEHDKANTDALAQLHRARTMFLSLADEDALGYGVLNAMWKLDKDNPERIAGWDSAVAGAIAPPRAMVALCLNLQRIIRGLVMTTNMMLKSDLGVAAVLCEASARAAAWNVRINLPLVNDDQRARLSSELDAQLNQICALGVEIEQGCA